MSNHVVILDIDAIGGARNQQTKYAARPTAIGLTSSGGTSSRSEAGTLFAWLATPILRRHCARPSQPRSSSHSPDRLLPLTFASVSTADLRLLRLGSHLYDSMNVPRRRDLSGSASSLRGRLRAWPVETQFPPLPIKVTS
jgi:hypothetical protein